MLHDNPAAIPCAGAPMSEVNVAEDEARLFQFAGGRTRVASRLGLPHSTSLPLFISHSSAVS
jgi:hypothetical protein